MKNLKEVVNVNINADIRSMITNKTNKNNIVAITGESIKIGNNKYEEFELLQIQFKINDIDSVILTGEYDKNGIIKIEKDKEFISFYKTKLKEKKEQEQRG